MDPDALLQRLCAPPGDPLLAPAVLILAAHPDDETVGAGARLPRLREAVLVHVTDGSPRDLYDARNSGCEAREEYARKRRSELSAALALAGLSPEQARQLGCVDQEAALNLAPLARLLAALLKELRPEVLLTHPYEGGHPDHDATAFIASAACRLLQREGETPPLLVEMTSYHNSPSGLCPEEFLPHPDVAVVTRVLSPEEREFKRRLVNCFPTQWGTLQYFPLEKECFRPAPPYDFTRAPHEGRLFYEGFEWGMTGERFRALAEEALRELGIGRG